LTSSGHTFSAVDKYLYGGVAGVATEGTITSFARSVLDDTDAATARTTLGAQAQDADLDALAALGDGHPVRVGGTWYAYGTNAVTPTNTTDATTGTAFWTSGTLAAGTYHVHGMVTTTSAASTTAPQFAVDGTATRTLSILQVDVTTTAVAGQPGNAIDTTGGIVYTNGNTGTTTERPANVHAYVTTTTSGTISLLLRSEVGGSQVDVVRGFILCERIS
jgi:hypothetical protein